MNSWEDANSDTEFQNEVHQIAKEFDNPVSNRTANVYVGPFARSILRGMVTDWLNKPQRSFTDKTPARDEVFDENDSFSWAELEMKQIEKELEW